MKLLQVIVLSALLPGLLQAGTFELSDPANEMYADQQAREQELAEELADIVEGSAGDGKASDLFCTVDSATDRCVCIDRVSVDVVEIPEAQCRELAASPPASTRAAGAQSAGMKMLSDTAVAVDVITDIDPERRVITLKSEETGGKYRFTAGPEVRNFDQLRRGDVVLTEYFEAFGLALGPKGSGLKDRVDTVEVDRADEGEKPGLRITDSTYVVGVVAEVDVENRIVALEGPERVLVMKVGEEADLSGLAAGQEVEALYIESFAIMVEPAPKVAGTLTMKSGAVALGVGVQWGNGTVTMWNGEEIGFKVRGLSLLDVGASSIEATGEVFHLVEPADLEGVYLSGEAGAALVAGGAALTMKNGKGVVIKLRSEQKGARLTLAGEGLSIRLD